MGAAIMTCLAHQQRMLINSAAAPTSGLCCSLLFLLNGLCCSLLFLLDGLLLNGLAGWCPILLGTPAGHRNTQK